VASTSTSASIDVNTKHYRVKPQGNEHLLEGQLRSPYRKSASEIAATKSCCYLPLVRNAAAIHYQQCNLARSGIFAVVLFYAGAQSDWHLELRRGVMKYL
jgi:hypothetical protein